MVGTFLSEDRDGDLGRDAGAVLGDIELQRHHTPRRGRPRRRAVAGARRRARPFAVAFWATEYRMIVRSLYSTADVDPDRSQKTGRPGRPAFRGRM